MFFQEKQAPFKLIVDGHGKVPWSSVDYWRVYDPTNGGRNISEVGALENSGCCWRWTFLRSWKHQPRSSWFHLHLCYKWQQFSWIFERLKSSPKVDHCFKSIKILIFWLSLCLKSTSECLQYFSNQKPTFAYLHFWKHHFAWEKITVVHWNRPSWPEGRRMLQPKAGYSWEQRRLPHPVGISNMLHYWECRLYIHIYIYIYYHSSYYYCRDHDDCRYYHCHCYDCCPFWSVYISI